MSLTQSLQIEVKKEKQSNAPKVYKWDIVWRNVIVLGLLHLGAVYGAYLRITSLYPGNTSYLLTKFIGLAGSIGITAGAHRLWSHRSYKANKYAETLLIIMATFTYQNSIYVWVRDHRLHHKHTETDADPHNARRGFFFSHVGWLMVRKHPQVLEKGKTLDMSDLQNNPIVMFQHRHYIKLVLLIAVIIPLTIQHYVLGVPWKEAIFLHTIYRYILTVNVTWSVNSISHLYGYRPFDKTIGATENMFAKIAVVGEGLHNYHHVYPWDYRSAEFGDDWRNLTSMFIDSLAAIGWVTDRKIASEAIINKRVQRTGIDAEREHTMRQSSPKKFFYNLSLFTMTCAFIILI